MSNHNKAYLICENKCLVEGIPKGSALVKFRRAVPSSSYENIIIDGNTENINLNEYRILCVNNIFISRDYVYVTNVLNYNSNLDVNNNVLSFDFSSHLMYGDVEIVLIRTDL